MRCQRTGLAVPVKLPQAIEAVLGKHIKHTLDRPPRHPRQLPDSLVGFALALEQDDLHPLLHARIRMLIPFLGQRLLHFLSEDESTHPCISVRPNQATAPTNFVGLPGFMPILPFFSDLSQEQFVSFHCVSSIATALLIFVNSGWTTDDIVTKMICVVVIRCG